MWRLIVGLTLLCVAFLGGAPQFGSQALRLLVPLAVALIISSIFSVFAHGNLFKQRAKNTKAWKLLSSTDRAERFVLYLRSFDSDEHAAPPRLHGRLTDLLADLESNGAFGSGSPIVRMIERSAVKAFGPMPVVGLAGPSAFMGPGQVTVYDSEWKTVISQLCKDAKAIIFVVGGSRGVRWELGFLRQARHLDKVVFLVPPMSELSYHYGRAFAEIIFARAQTIFKEFGISIPPPGKRSKLFTIDAQHSLNLLPESRDALIDALRGRAVELN